MTHLRPAPVTGDGDADEIARIFVQGWVPGFSRESKERMIEQLASQLRGAHAEGLAAGESKGLQAVGEVLVEIGCDCDLEGPHDGIDCEDHGHEPCAMCRIERAMNKARRAGREGK